MALDVAGLPVLHGVALDVMTTVITSSFASEVVVKVALVASEISVPPFFHR